MPPLLPTRVPEIAMLMLSSTQDEPRIFVESEDQPDRMLLETKISKDDGYQKQQGLIIGAIHALYGRITDN